MRIPKRKTEEDARKLRAPQDDYMTAETIQRIKQKLERLKKIEQPKGIKEVQRTQEMGDLSENAAYQDAKWRLRRINNQILTLEDKIRNAIPIKATGLETVQIGSMVTMKTNKGQLKLQILGTAESDPSRGKISYSSPLGQALLGKKENETVTVSGAEYLIQKIT
ncbi:GreA/GreB family elongation factor [Patescibacteria group bacterium]|nr:GreA/GreB family elongation factor [Patescibacteria group bacterium]